MVAFLVTAVVGKNSIAPQRVHPVVEYQAVVKGWSVTSTHPSGESRPVREVARERACACNPVDAKFPKTESGLEPRQAGRGCGGGAEGLPRCAGAGFWRRGHIRPVNCGGGVVGEPSVRPDKWPFEHVWAGYVCATWVKGEGSRGPSSGCSSCSWVSMLMTLSSPEGPAF